MKELTRVFVIFLFFALAITGCRRESELERLQGERKAIKDTLERHRKVHPFFERSIYRQCLDDLKPKEQCEVERDKTQKFHIDEQSSLERELKPIEERIRQIQADAYANSHK